MAKYTKEEKQKAIDLYIRYCKQATKAIKNLTQLSTLPIGWIEVKNSAILRDLATHRTKFNHMLYLLQPRAPWRTVRRKASRKNNIGLCQVGLHYTKRNYIFSGTMRSGINL